jgi:MurNAc alpha-1-phosphate uridylyltransferase
MKAMLLAAGRGSRLRPLTDDTPKPLLSVGSRLLIERNFEILRKANIREVVINIWHHAEQIMETLGDGRRFGVNIIYSDERPEILGTAGGIRRALPLLGDEPFLVISADTWSEFLLTEKFMHLENGRDAHLLLVENPSYHANGDYGMEVDGRVHTNAPKWTYAGIATLRPSLFLDCPEGHTSLSPLLNQAIERGTVSGELYQGVWFNVGTLQELERLRESLL